MSNKVSVGKRGLGVRNLISVIIKKLFSIDPEVELQPLFMTS